MGFLVFLLVVGFLFFVLPRLLLHMWVNKARKHTSSFFSSAASQAERPRRAGWTKPAAHKKKIDKNVGEYVSFEEIKSSSTTVETDTATYNETETQIVDAEWEDI